ncbi:PREDICTED: spermatogenesis- and oogenesis-specific basic helix-loop-helix-containing protein 1 isoform X1 [Mandrillus leucophaeus]|uniref:spermatogenesis- and oogenesis-specific basic helix-loop-helix-containing protein 1 isoform X1 n=1 Tax=Mandrillus leucophaeus TaxID=9568 RepID=UPI0005F5610D|nr:PREDICTED: spermatogenesis- and oogenesis-specific basic helix-loop-helix-containing protein 1 isoform X1 [Mandrillus leucophaeus]
MASRCSEPDPEVSGVPTARGCNGSSLSGALSCCEDSAQGSGQPKAPTVAEGPSSCLRRNVISERERRKRISLSCERLRALLPQFDGRREDMASVLEMSVQFLRLASALGPSQEQHAMLASSKEMWHSLQEDVLQLTLSSQIPAGVPDSGTGASGGTRTPDVKAFLESPWSRDPASAGPEPLPHVLASSRHWDPPSCTSLGTDKCEVLSGLCQVRGGPPPFSEPSSLVPWPPGPSLPKAVRPPLSWPLFSQQQTLPMMSGEAPGWLGQAGPLAMGAVPLGEPAEEAPMPVQEARSVLGSDMEDGTSFLLTAGPSWWPGFSVGEPLPGSGPTGVLGLGPPGSLEGRGGSGPAWAPAESSLLDQGEPGFLGDPEPGSQELQDSPLEPWSLDVDCAGLALKDEMESIFPDFFAC